MKVSVIAGSDDLIRNPVASTHRLGCGQARHTHTTTHTQPQRTKKKPKNKKKRGLAASSYEPASSDVPHPSFHPHRPVHLSSVLAATSNRRSVQVQAEPWTESGGTKKGAGVVESGTEWTSFRSSLTLASVGMVRRFGDEGRGGKPYVCVWRQTMQARLRSRASGGGVRDGRKSSGMVWHGMVWCGLVGSAVGDHPLAPCPLCLCEDLHERALCSGPAGAPVSE